MLWNNFTIEGVTAKNVHCPVISYTLYNASQPWAFVAGQLKQSKPELPEKPENVTLQTDCPIKPCRLIQFSISNLTNHTFYILAEAEGGAQRLLPTVYRYVVDTRIRAGAIGAESDASLVVINNTVSEDFDTIGCNADGNSAAGVDCAGNATIDKEAEAIEKNAKDTIIEKVKASKDEFMRLAKEKRARYAQNDPEKKQKKREIHMEIEKIEATGKLKIGFSEAL